MVLSSAIVCDRLRSRSQDRRRSQTIADDRRSVFPYDRRRSQNFLRSAIRDPRSSAIIWKPALSLLDLFYSLKIFERQSADQVLVMQQARTLSTAFWDALIMSNMATVARVNWRTFCEIVRWTLHEPAKMVSHKVDSYSSKTNRDFYWSVKLLRGT